MKFLVVDTPWIMNVIMGREWIHAIKGGVSTLHKAMKCQSPNGLYTIYIKGDQSQSRRFDKVKDVEEEISEDVSNK